MEGQKPDPASLRASFKLGPAGSQRESLTLACPVHGFASAELGVPSEVSAGQELIQPPKAEWEMGTQCRDRRGLLPGDAK